MKTKFSWLKGLMASAACIVSAVAVLTSQTPCLGQYYQPEVPEKLRK
ncbi:cyclic lactone autoinducer peptide [Agathobaculum sp. NTUH-O15-33]